MQNLPPLNHGFEWRYKNNRPVACLLTLDVDCYVEVTVHGSVSISTGVAPIDVVKTVIEVNQQLDQDSERTEITESDIIRLEVLLNGEFLPIGWLYTNVYENLRGKGLCVNSGFGYGITALGIEVVRKHRSLEKKNERENSNCIK